MAGLAHTVHLWDTWSGLTQAVRRGEGAAGDEVEWNLLREHAHRFAPSLEFLGLSSLKSVINQIEDFSLNRRNLELLPSLIQKLETECTLVSEQLNSDFNL
jgi:HPt (histidine-containing phosphotransfer) domain-containing protein